MEEQKKVNFSKVRIIMICILSALFLTLPLIFYAIYNITDGSVWLGFWASYIGGLCTLIAVVITIVFESAARKKENKKLSEQLAQQFERDLDLRRIEKFEDASINFKIFMLKLNPKLEKTGDKITFNHGQILDEMYEKYSLFKQYYYNICSDMNQEIKVYFQDAIKSYSGYLNKLKDAELTNLQDAEALREKLDKEYKNNHAKKNKHGFIDLRQDIIEYVKKKYSGEQCK